MRLLEELKRRRVVRISIAYVVAGWAMIEAASVLLPMFGAPDWSARAFTIAVALGFPAAVTLAWLVQWTDEGLTVDRGEARPAKTAQNKVHFVRAPDGTQLAYVLSGSGPPLVKTAHWLTHLEKDWSSPLWAHWLASLGDGRRLLRYDERGCGLSDRDASDLGFDAFVVDLETVVDAAGLDRFALFGASQGGPVSVAYAARHPERVSALVLYGSYARGWAKAENPELIRREKAMVELIRVGWGQNNPAFRELYASLFVPDASPAQTQSFIDMARDSTSPATAARLMLSFSEIDVRDLLPGIRVPTLVVHVRHDARIAAGNGRELAAGIPGAELVTIEGRNHIILDHEPAFTEFKTVVDEFLKQHAI